MKTPIIPQSDTEGGVPAISAVPSEPEREILDAEWEIVPVPFERLTEQARLTPAFGARDPFAQGRCLIDAENDAQAASAWVHDKGTSPATFKAYRKEIERFFWWLVKIQYKSFATVSREDVAAYRSFLEAPPPSWIAPASTRRGSLSWRPFNGPLNDRSRAHAIVIVSACFQYLKDVNYLGVNPFAVDRRKRSDVNEQLKTARERVIPYWALQPFLRVLQERADEMSGARRTVRSHAERDLFIVRFLVNTGLRRHELVAANMADVQRGSNPKTGAERWFLQVLGKGKKNRKVALNAAALDAIRRYRNAHNATARFIGNDTPLLLPLLGRNAAVRHLDDQMVYRAVKRAMEAAALRLIQDDPDAAHVLSKATPHYLRHTFATVMQQMGVEPKLIQQQLGHESIDTTMAIYVHTDEDALYDAVAAHPL